MTSHQATQATGSRPLEILVIGAGLGGIAAAIEFTGHGLGDVRVLEAAPDIGGTWFYNS